MAEELDFYEAWNQRVKQVSDAWREFGLCFVEHYQLLIEEIMRFTEKYQRTTLALRLGGSKFAWWIANHWPKRWLPIPKFTGDEDE